LREFHFADILPDPGIELIVGGPGIEFRIYNASGKLLEEIIYGRGLLDHFTATDIDNDGKIEILASFNGGRRITIQCISGKELVWENNTPDIIAGGSDSGMNIATGDFAKVPESTLILWRDALTKMETPNLEYLVMYEASDLYGHERGQKMTTA
jgi:hypothetical protein